eukprot:2547984-Pyramimonas_sp.AAC.3
MEVIPQHRAEVEVPQAHMHGPRLIGAGHLHADNLWGGSLSVIGTKVPSTKAPRMRACCTTSARCWGMT